jgi:hypothetical protein
VSIDRLVDGPVFFFLVFAVNIMFYIKNEYGESMKKSSALRSVLFGSCFIFCAQLASEKAVKKGFTLLDEVCIVIEGEPPVLKSHIAHRAHRKEISFKAAENELLQEKLMWVYAKKNQVKYNTVDIFKATDDHIKQVMEDNKLTKEKFTEVLMGRPYLTTFSQFRLDTATAMLENRIKSLIASQITISDIDVKEEVTKAKLATENQYDIVFISIGPEKIFKKHEKFENKNRLIAQIEKANKIRAQITPHTSLDEVKTRYGGEIVIEGPIAYEKGALKHNYEEQLKSGSSQIVTKPFSDNGMITMIWKIKKSHHEKLDDDALLEKVRKKLYAAAVEEQFNKLTSGVMDHSTAVVKSCKER